MCVKSLDEIASDVLELDYFYLSPPPTPACRGARGLLPQSVLFGVVSNMCYNFGWNFPGVPEFGLF